MGGGHYDEEEVVQIREERRREGAPVFKYHDQVERGVVERKVHPSLDIFGKRRESRDHSDHPGIPAIPIMIWFDVTGSMCQTPEIMERNFQSLMTPLTQKRGDNPPYVDRAQVLIAAVGDTHGDKFPIQVGQFEADARIHENLTNLMIEKGGGRGTIPPMESYELALYFSAFRTDLDIQEKWNRKGYLFMFGDERPYPESTPQELARHLGVEESRPVPVQAIIKAAQEKFHVFFIIPGGTFHFDERDLAARWEELLGEQFVLQLPDIHACNEVISLVVGLTEKRVASLEDGISHLGEVPVGTHRIVRSALARYAKSLEM